MGKGGALSIRTKMVLVFGAAFTLSVALLLSGLAEFSRVKRTAHDLREIWIPKQTALGHVDRQIAEHRLLADRLLAHSEHEDIRWLLAALKETEQALSSRRASYLSYPSSAREQAQFATVDAHWRAYFDAHRRAFALHESERHDLARQLFTSRAVDAHLAARNALSVLLEQGLAINAQAAAASRQAYQRAWTLVLCAIAFTGALAVATIWWTASTISAPVRRVADTMRRLTAGEDTAFTLRRGERSEEVLALSEAASGYRETLIESRRLAQEAERDRQRLDIAISHMPIGLAMFDAEKRLIICNTRYGEIYGLPAELTRTGAPFADIRISLRERAFFSDASAQSFSRELARLMEEGKPFTSILDGAEGRSINITCTPMACGGWVSTHEDITSRRQLDAQTRYLAHHDPLTGLSNRVAFDAALAMALEDVDAQELAVFCLDLDRFKPVNDTYGHAVGDQLLKAIAARLRGALRDTDMAARLGGDEFVILQTNAVQPAAAIALAERLLSTLSRPYRIDDRSIEIGVSIGVAQAPLHAVEAVELLRCADAALYRAKADGRGVFRLFEHGMTFEDLQQRA